MIDELFDKIIYESEEFKEIQKNIDCDLEQIIKQCGNMQEAEKEEMRDLLTGMLYQTEREIFALGFKYGVRLMNESKINSDDIHNF